ncbi:peroxisome biogenesis factor 10 [Copidosoma floridanum]|uniref:peroxisome biogenesis factor 10 n=1 Tax=Copidosoma floridanum TaxID=29053 RepID=UPI0006C93E0F|nr:peroxisome biogenesis factor 10 [Copidosoma floridanum]
MSERTATQAEILRSHQRDNDFISQISENLTDLLHRYNLHRNFSRFMKSEIPAKLLYFIVTSGLGNQTLGEEYTGIIQADLITYRVPSLMRRVIAAILECFGEQMLMRLLEKLQVKINRPDSDLMPQAKAFLNTFLSKLRMVLPIFILVHKGLFYIYGRYYSIGRRLTGVDYLKAYGPRPHSSVSWGLRILGFATIAQCLCRLWQYRNVKDKSMNEEKEFENISGGRCQLCLEKIPDTATPCGHLFCWSCLAEWLRARNRCPLCRETVSPTRIIPLMNL